MNFTNVNWLLEMCWWAVINVTMSAWPTSRNGGDNSSDWDDGSSFTDRHVQNGPAVLTDMSKTAVKMWNEDGWSTSVKQSACRRNHILDVGEMVLQTWPRSRLHSAWAWLDSPGSWNGSVDGDCRWAVCCWPVTFWMTWILNWRTSKTSWSEERMWLSESTHLTDRVRYIVDVVLLCLCRLSAFRRKVIDRKEMCRWTGRPREEIRRHWCHW